MFAVVVQNDNHIVEKVIRCRNLVEVQATLENLQPDMDSEYLMTGDLRNVTFDNKTYSFIRLETAFETV